MAAQVVVDTWGQSEAVRILAVLAVRCRFQTCFPPTTSCGFFLAPFRGMNLCESEGVDRSM